VPSITLSAEASTTLSETLPSYDLTSPVKTWASPLASADVNTLMTRWRTARRSLRSDATADGRYTAPLRARVGVRLKDDSYLWLGDAVEIGAATWDNAERVVAQVTAEDDEFVHVAEHPLGVLAYRLGITPVSGIDESWHSIVKCVDILVTDEADVVTDTLTSYRCETSTTGTRTYWLRYGGKARTESAVGALLDSSRWWVAASTTDLAALSEGRFVADNVTDGSTDSSGHVTGLLQQPLARSGAGLTNDECDAAGDSLANHTHVQTIMNNGRLYSLDDDGVLRITEPGNPLVTTAAVTVTGATPIAIAAVTGPLYASSFGRYAVYLFTTQGIYAVPQSSSGVCGEPRLVDRTVAQGGVTPTEAAGDVFFLDRWRRLCRLHGARVQTVMTDADVTQMVWCPAYRELWLLPSTGLPTVVMESGRMSVRTVNARQLWGDTLRARVVTSDGEVLDLCDEESSTMSITWRSHPFAAGDGLTPLRASRVVWNVSGDALTLQLSVMAHRGVDCHGFIVNALKVSGNVNAPFPVTLLSQPLRTLRLSVTGLAPTGTLVLPTSLSVSE